MLQVMAIPVKPTTHCLDNLLPPLSEELQMLQNYGGTIVCNDRTFHGKVHAMIMAGDIVGVRKLFHHKTFRSKYECHMCYIKPKAKCSRNGNGSTKCLVGNPDDVYTMRSTVDFTEEAFKDDSIALQQGITAPTPLAKLDAFHGYSFAGGPITFVWLEC